MSDQGHRLRVSRLGHVQPRRGHLHAGVRRLRAFLGWQRYQVYSQETVSYLNEFFTKLPI